MAKTKMNTPKKNVMERNIMLSGEIMRYLLNSPQVFQSLPDSFELVILPDGDPEMRLYNLELLDKHGSEGKPIVFARIKAHHGRISADAPPSLFVPVPATA